MPYIIEFPIANGDRPPPSALYRALHANLLAWIGAADAGLATALHDRPVRKPYTISALEQGRNGAWRWRVTLLQDDLWEPLWTGVQSVGALDLDGHTWPVRWPDAHVVHRAYDLLLTNVRPANHIRLRFVSPTTFSAGRLDLPLPEPSAVFKSWLSRWNDFCPPDRRISTDLLETVHTHVGIDAHRLRTERHDLGRGRPPVGFVGQVVYTIIRAQRLDQALVWQIDALADYAPFCGTGRKTTHGMGQTRRERD
jgi:CRISPR-associated endoribonuclease Cas6